MSLWIVGCVIIWESPLIHKWHFSFFFSSFLMYRWSFFVMSIPLSPPPRKMFHIGIPTQWQHFLSGVSRRENLNYERVYRLYGRTLTRPSFSVVNVSVDLDSGCLDIRSVLAICWGQRIHEKNPTHEAHSTFTGRVQSLFINFLISSRCNRGTVRYHCGGWPKEVNTCFLNSYMVYL